MKKSDLTYLVGSVFIAVTSICYCATIWFHIQIPRYYPLEHVWKMVSEKGVPSQGWYGMQLFAYLAAAIFATLVYFGSKKFFSPNYRLSPTATKSIGATTLSIVVICMAYLLHHEFHKWGIY